MYALGKRSAWVAASLALATLAGCGGRGSDGGDKAAGGGGAAGAGSVAPAGWNVLDACATIDKAKVAESLGRKVESAELSAVRDGSQGNGDRYSQCAYGFGGLDIIVIGTGESYGDPTLAEQVESMKSEMKIGSDTPAESVPGIGQAALWNPGLRALYVFPGGKRFLSFTMGKVGEPDQKAAAVALARKLGV